MINEKEALSKLFVDLCKIQEDFSKVFPPAPEVITSHNSSEESLEIYNKISTLIDNVEDTLIDKFNVDTFMLNNPNYKGDK
jgi:hypothetical protein